MSLPKPKTGYSCPACNTHATRETLLYHSPLKFRAEPDPHYVWVETHQCSNCEKEYYFNNNT